MILWYQVDLIRRRILETPEGGAEEGWDGGWLAADQRLYDAREHLMPVRHVRERFRVTPEIHGSPWAAGWAQALAEAESLLLRPREILWIAPYPNTGGNPLPPLPSRAGLTPGDLLRIEMMALENEAQWFPLIDSQYVDPYKYQLAGWHVQLLPSGRIPTP